MKNYYDISKERVRKWQIMYFASAEKIENVKKMSFLDAIIFHPLYVFATKIRMQIWTFSQNLPKNWKSKYPLIATI